MKPRNFPGSKNRRRIAAFTRIKKQEGPLPQHLQNLVENIMPESTARTIRTKKNRASLIPR